MESVRFRRSGNNSKGRYCTRKFIIILAVVIVVMLFANSLIWSLFSWCGKKDNGPLYNERSLSFIRNEILMQEERISKVGPPLITHEGMKKYIYGFYRLFKERIAKSNVGGMVALYCILKKLEPDIVIETGAFQGHSTWMIRNTLPQARIFSFDPEDCALCHEFFLDPSKLTKHYRGIDFIDINYVQLPIKKSDNVLVFISDGMPFADRFFRLYKDYNITHFIEKNNYPFNWGTHYTLQSIMNNNRAEYVPNIHYSSSASFDFAEDVKETKLPADLHYALHWFFRAAVERYQEFPNLRKDRPDKTEHLNLDVPYLYEEGAEVKKLAEELKISVDKLNHLNEIDDDSNFGYVELKPYSNLMEN